jgi:hypothetical protein
VLPVLPVVLVVVLVPGTPAPPEPPLPVFPAAVPPPVLPEEAAPVLPVFEVEPEVLVVVVFVLEVEDVSLGGALLVGIVRVGDPAVSAGVEPPPPQAETPTASATPAARAAIALAMRVRREVTAWTSGPEGIHPTPAMRTIVEILLSKLIAPIAEAEVLDRPRQLRRGGGQGQDDGYGLERLGGLPVQVGAPGLGLNHDLSPRGGRAQAVLLVEPHHFDATSGQRRRTPPRHHRLSLG